MLKYLIIFLRDGSIIISANPVLTTLFRAYFSSLLIRCYITEVHGGKISVYLKNAFNDIRDCPLPSPSRNFDSHVETVKRKERSERKRDPGRAPKLEERLHEASRGSCGRILFGTSIRPADGKLISARKITNGRWNTSGGNLPAGSVRLAKNRLLAPAASIGPDIIAAITGNRCPSGRLEEAKSPRLMSSSYVIVIPPVARTVDRHDTHD
ncbi:hypothetical protein X777_15497 [Ooceraea biroi]|uniref:Uncharacterized protein n=1 Tax=Ooceraea biroi TaxID=2015173 RepID=A0A026VXC0_OOCBI|nr:hypothetical protein X777_15497 [Ooceraea biroi]